MTVTKQQSNKQVVSVEECVEFLTRTIAQLRDEKGISESDQVSLYVTDAPIIHSTLAEYREDILEKANLADIVQVNIKAGNPMPEALTHVECTIGDDIVTVAIEPQTA